MTNTTLEDFMTEMKRYNVANYTPPASQSQGDLLESLLTASIRFFSDGSAEFYDKNDNPVKGHSLAEIYDWLVQQNNA